MARMPWLRPSTAISFGNTFSLYLVVTCVLFSSPDVLSVADAKETESSKARAFRPALQSRRDVLSLPSHDRVVVFEPDGSITVSVTQHARMVSVRDSTIFEANHVTIVVSDGSTLSLYLHELCLIRGNLSIVVDSLAQLQNLVICRPSVSLPLLVGGSVNIDTQQAIVGKVQLGLLRSICANDTSGHCGIFVRLQQSRVDTIQANLRPERSVPVNIYGSIMLDLSGATTMKTFVIHGMNAVTGNFIVNKRDTSTWEKVSLLSDQSLRVGGNVTVDGCTASDESAKPAFVTQLQSLEFVGGAVTGSCQASLSDSIVIPSSISMEGCSGTGYMSEGASGCKCFSAKNHLDGCAALTNWGAMFPSTWSSDTTACTNQFAPFAGIQPSSPACPGTYVIPTSRTFGVDNISLSGVYALVDPNCAIVAVSRPTVVMDNVMLPPDYPWFAPTHELPSALLEWDRLTSENQQRLAGQVTCIDTDRLQIDETTGCAIIGTTEPPSTRSTEATLTGPTNQPENKDHHLVMLAIEASLIAVAACVVLVVLLVALFLVRRRARRRRHAANRATLLLMEDEQLPTKDDDYQGPPGSDSRASSAQPSPPQAAVTTQGYNMLFCHPDQQGNIAVDMCGLPLQQADGYHEPFHQAASTLPRSFDSSDLTPLMTFARENDVQQLNWALEHGVDINAMDDRRWTALTHAVVMNNTAACRRILACPHAAVNSKDELGRAAIHWAAACNSCGCLEQLLVDDKVDLTVETEQGSTFLHILSAQEHYETISVCVDILCQLRDSIRKALGTATDARDRTALDVLQESMLRLEVDPWCDEQELKSAKRALAQLQAL